MCPLDFPDRTVFSQAIWHHAVRPRNFSIQYECTARFVNRGWEKKNLPYIQNVLSAHSEEVITFLKLQFSHLCMSDFYYSLC